MGHISPKEYKTKSEKIFQIRTAEPTDAPRLLVHKRSVMGEQIFTLTLPEELPTEVEEANCIRSAEANPSSLIIVAVIADEIVGGIDFSSGHRQRIAHTGDFGMSVSANFRGSGIGNALLESLLEWATSHPIIEKVCLKVHATNARAIGLYNKFGFFEEGRQSKDLKYGPNQYVDTILMAKFIK